MTSTAMLCSTSSKPDSATFWMPLGTNARLRLPATKSTAQMIVEMKHIIAVLLNPSGPKLRQSKSSLTPLGKSSASTITVTPSLLESVFFASVWESERGLRPGAPGCEPELRQLEEQQREVDERDRQDEAGHVVLGDVAQDHRHEGDHDDQHRVAEHRGERGRLRARLRTGGHEPGEQQEVRADHDEAERGPEDAGPALRASPATSNTIGVAISARRVRSRAISVS